MSGITNTIRKIVPKEDPLTHGLLTKQLKMERGWNKSLGLSKAPAPAPAPVIPLPDEEVLQKQARRRVSRGGRASTVLSADDQLGP